MPDRYFVRSRHSEDMASGKLGEPGEWVVGVDPTNPYDKAKIDAGVFVLEQPNPINATDAAEAKAAKLEVDLSTVPGTGSGGRITVDDVESAANPKANEEESP
jgi:pyruvate/2-oxoglutarate dehydrogenase complex dihydrolipoamide acyltransferase (E2) component